MRLLGWALIQYDWCPYKKGKWTHKETLGVGTHGEKTTGRHRGEAAHLEATEVTPAETNPAKNLILDFLNF